MVLRTNSDVMFPDFSYHLYCTLELALKQYTKIKI